jgi:uncharacterized protein (TIGR02145 family)
VFTKSNKESAIKQKYKNKLQLIKNKCLSFKIVTAGKMLMLAIAAGFLIQLMINQSPPESSAAVTINEIEPYSGSVDGGQTVKITVSGIIPTPPAPTTMQELTQEYCASLPAYDKTNPTSAQSLASTIVLPDARNGQNYTIRKLQDDNCWMVDNLKLELGVANADPTLDTTVLEPENTNIATNKQIYFTKDGTSTGQPLSGMTGNFTTSGYLDRDGGPEGMPGPKFDAWRQANPNSVSAYCRGEGVDFLGKPFPAGFLSGCGYLYNFYTATAGSSSEDSFGTAPHVAGYKAPESICPANWRLPSGYHNAADINNDTPILKASMAANKRAATGSVAEGSHADWFSGGSFRGLLSGEWAPPSYYQGGTGAYWTSSLAKEFFAYQIFINVDSSSPGNSSDVRHSGHAIRCLHEGGAQPTVPATLPTVSFGGQPATNVQVTSNGDGRHTIAATTPSAQAKGAVDVVVDNGTDPAVTLTNGFRYFSNIQDMTAEDCSNMSVYDTTNPEAIEWLNDPRGAGQSYKVAKLADGKCWMINNLRLGYFGATDGVSGDGTLSLTPADTNITADWTLPRLDSEKTSSFTTPRAHSFWDDKYIYGIEHTDPESQHFYGYHYNWCAVTAGGVCLPQGADSPAAVGDICPANWRMPTGGSGNSSDFRKLFMAYDDNAEAFKFMGAFKGVLGGNFIAGWAGQYNTGEWWGNLEAPSELATTMQVSGKNATPENTRSRNAAFPVRCLLDSEPVEPQLTVSIDSTDLNFTDPEGDDNIAPTTESTEASVSNTLTVATNLDGYELAVSTDQPNTNYHASDMPHQSQDHTFLHGTDHTCSWNTTATALDNTDAAIANNTWGFTLDTSLLGAHKLCQVPDSDSPIRVKSTQTANLSGDNTTIYYGTKVDLHQLAGKYRTHVMYTITAGT